MNVPWSWLHFTSYQCLTLGNHLRFAAVCFLLGYVSGGVRRTSQMFEPLERDLVLAGNRDDHRHSPDVILPGDDFIKVL